MWIDKSITLASEKNIKYVVGILYLLSCLFLPEISYSQVSISPTSLFFDSNNRFGSLIVNNSSSQAQEVSITTEFGYPASINGQLYIQKDSALAAEKSLESWLKMFPQSFTLQPQQRQVVRFVTQPPQNLKAGGYWSRVKIKSNPLSPSIESVGANQVGAQINLIVEQVIAAQYHTSGAETGVEVRSIKFDKKSNSLMVALRQTDNAPFMGTIQLSVTGPGGKQIFNTNTTLSVYTEMMRSFSLDTVDLPSGAYNATAIVTSNRRDIDSNKLLQIKPVTSNQTFTIE